MASLPEDGFLAGRPRDPPDGTWGSGVATTAGASSWNGSCSAAVPAGRPGTSGNTSPGGGNGGCFHCLQTEIENRIISATERKKTMIAH